MLLRIPIRNLHLVVSLLSFQQWHCLRLLLCLGRQWLLALSRCSVQLICPESHNSFHCSQLLHCLLSPPLHRLVVDESSWCSQPRIVAPGIRRLKVHALVLEIPTDDLFTYCYEYVAFLTLYMRPMVWEDVNESGWRHEEWS
jgi:hypothetical protein